MPKLYAVRKGRRTGIFSTWKECEEQVRGYSGAEFKSFTSETEAKKFLLGSISSEDICIEDNSLKNKEKPTLDNSDEDKVLAYVDGSYNIATKEYGSGIVILFKGQKETYSIKGEDSSLAEMRNVAGEIKGAEMAMEYALNNKIPKLAIYYDYEGIEKWCTGAWKANKEGTKNYKKFYDNISKYVQVEFIKVRAHTGDVHNEEADILAKKSVGNV